MSAIYGECALQRAGRTRGWRDGGTEPQALAGNICQERDHDARGHVDNQSVHFRAENRKVGRGEYKPVGRDPEKLH